MTIYYADKNGQNELAPDHFSKNDKSIKEGEPSFATSIGLTPRCIRDTFFGASDHAFNYLLFSNVPYRIVTHPQVTFTIEDKVAMYNNTGCKPDGTMQGEGIWQPKDLIEAVYFVDQRTGKYHIAVFPGKEPGRYIDVRASFDEPAQALMHKYPPGAKDKNPRFSVKKRLQPMSLRDQLAFDSGQSGFLSGLIPDYIQQDGEVISARDMVDAMYFDKHALMKGVLDHSMQDMSIALGRIPAGGYIERAIRRSHAVNLTQLVNGQREGLEIKQEGGSAVAVVDHPLMEDYSDRATKPADGEESVMLKFTYLPSHMISLLINYKDLHDIIDWHFGGDMKGPIRRVFTTEFFFETKK